MPFKVHLLIVACIIAVVYGIWQIMNVATPAAEGTESQGVPHKIMVTHASYGLNCRTLAIADEAVPHDAFNAAARSNPKISEDNVLNVISSLCNGQTECEILLDKSVLGEDPAPECAPKTLEVEYRCFSYDRPWRIKANSGSVKLICATNKAKP